MTIHEFLAFWHAQPFRAFRMITVRGEFDVAFPLQIGLTPTLRVALAVDGTRVETFALDEITRCAAIGAPVDLATLIGGLSPEAIARNAELLATATTAPEVETVAEQPATARLHAGTVALLAAHHSTGVFLIQAHFNSGDGTPQFSTAGTRWNLHGLEQFENGTSLYLHHLDHPTKEQRIILWPPDSGTFDSFAEAMPLADIGKALRQRDAKLAAKPEKEIIPTAAYFRSIVTEYEPPPRDARAEFFGEDDPALAPERFAFDCVLTTTAAGLHVHNPVLTDFMREEIIFNLTETAWDATGTRNGRSWILRLRHPEFEGNEFTLSVDCDNRAARINDDDAHLPLAFIERHLRNAALYHAWDRMLASLRAGPPQLRQPDLELPLPDGFRAELWAGETRFPLPFLQPRITDRGGKTVFDLRMTAWAAELRVAEARPLVTLRFLSDEAEAREAAMRLPVVLDLKTHRVTCPGVTGSTSIGMLQALVRHVRGTKWMLEELPKWFEKGAPLPLPG